MKRSLYEKLLAYGKQAIEAVERPFKVAAEMKNLELKIINLESEIATKQVGINSMKAEYPINWDKLIKQVDEVELAKRKLKQLESLKDELFITQVDDEEEKKQ